ncbi:cysteine-rich repeat secretory protein 38-like [Rhododendron vialii]|uniref:cysteine-rich repeat secretory protein 38-like n=1 Tax=Rhododendron vialii TaxID=182163 RepID=UPI00265F162E|nr:cysteine-rich repeat secretory protein 38-like [Rhododendron vialii]
MSSARLLSPLYLLSLSLLLQLAFGDNPISYTCYDSGNFTSNGPYNQNLENLLTVLDSKTPLTGFASGSLGQSQNQTYGLALCRGDINSTACQACVDEATTEIQNVCQFKNEAIIWYDVCQVKYSNVDFLGVFNTTEQWRTLWNTAIASDPVYFNKMVIELFSQLEGEARDSPKLYATGALDIGNSTTIYGLAQCTRDLSGVNCAKCIEEATQIITTNTYARLGVRFFGESCNVHYEMYPWV